MVNYIILSFIILALNLQPASAETSGSELAYVIQSVGPDGQVYQYDYESPYQTQTEYQEYYSQPYQTRSYYTAPQRPYIQSPVNQTYQTYPYYNPAYQTYPYYNPAYIDPYTYPARPSYQPSNRGIMHYYFGHD